MFTLCILRDIWMENIPDVKYVGGDSQNNRFSVKAAYNKNLGNDKKTGWSIFGYFNENLEMFAWAHGNDWTSDIGSVADHMKLSSHRRDDVIDGEGKLIRSYQVFYLVPIATSI